MRQWPLSVRIPEVRSPVQLAIGADLTAEMLERSARPQWRAHSARAYRCDGGIRSAMAPSTSSSPATFSSSLPTRTGRCRDLARCLAPGGAIIISIGGSGIREALRNFATEEQWSQLAHAAFPSRRRIVAAENEDPHREAMSRASLAIDTRDAELPSDLERHRRMDRFCAGRRSWMMSSAQSPPASSMRWRRSFPSRRFDLVERAAYRQEAALKPVVTLLNRWAYARLQNALPNPNAVIPCQPKKVHSEATNSSALATWCRMRETVYRSRKRSAALNGSLVKKSDAKKNGDLRFEVHMNEAGQILLSPHPVSPHESWLYKNPKALASSVGGSRKLPVVSVMILDHLRICGRRNRLSATGISNARLA